MALRRAFLCRSSSFHHPVTKSSLNLSSGFVDMKGKIKSLDCEKDRGSDEDTSEEIVDSNPEDQWSKMPPELLGEIVQRIETSEDRWPMRKNVVTCACVCKKWREVTRAIVKSAHRSGRITFPSSLKEAGPRNPPVQCVIKRNKRTSTFYLYLGLTDSLLSGEKGKLLLAARRFRHGAHTEYVISLSADDLSQGSNAYVGKLSSDFLGSKFTIYDNQPPYDGARPAINRASRRKQICPQVPAGSFEIGKVSYKFNILRSRGPRRMLCKIQCPTEKETTDDTKNTGNAENQMPSFSNREAVLVNQPPRWHEQLQCWCLNFHGRVTVASVKNFQLIATVDPSQPESKGDNELVLLQFGKVGEDMFTMDYRQPLSAFHAFAICLTSFGTKIACE